MLWMWAVTELELEYNYNLHQTALNILLFGFHLIFPRAWKHEGNEL